MLGSNPGWVQVEQREENMRNSIRQTKSLTDKPFGVNITIFAMEKLSERLVDIALEEGVKVIVTSGGSPRLFAQKIRDAGARVLHVIGNVNMAKTAEDAGVDMVVAEGYEAGGVNFPDELTTFVLVPYVVDAVKIPVVAAGGISDARGFVAALVLGAEGVQMGSRFVATKECHVHNGYKEAIVKAQDTDTVITRRALGLRIRSLKNEFINSLLTMDQQGAVEEMKAYIGMGKAREGQILGDESTGDMNIGQIAGRIDKVESAGDVVHSVIGGTDSVIRKCLELQGR
jgi:enoyl-[acyl-carrier protein] reductase II